MRKRGDSQAFVQLEDGRGRVECAFFAEAYQEFAQLLTRDRILLVEGGLREDEFSGGFSLRARRCWDYMQVCGQHAQRLSVQVDLRRREELAQFERVLHGHARQHAGAGRGDHRSGGRPAQPQRRQGRARGCRPARAAAQPAGSAGGEAGDVEALGAKAEPSPCAPRSACFRRGAVPACAGRSAS